MREMPESPMKSLDEVRTYLEIVIDNWRAMKRIHNKLWTDKEFSEKASHYIDAFQAVYDSIFDETYETKTRREE